MDPRDLVLDPCDLPGGVRDQLLRDRLWARVWGQRNQLGSAWGSSVAM
jgi:hypothetical protein